MTHTYPCYNHNPSDRQHDWKLISRNLGLQTIRLYRCTKCHLWEIEPVTRKEYINARRPDRTATETRLEIYF